MARMKLENIRMNDSPERNSPLQKSFESVEVCAVLTKSLQHQLVVESLFTTVMVWTAVEVDQMR